VNCPHCGRDFVPVEGQRFCSWCGAPLGTASGVSHEKHPDQGALGGQAPSAASELIPPKPAEYCPWEDQEHLGFMQGISQTVRQSLLSPKEFFSRLPRHGGLLNPLFYALIVGTVGSMADYLWSIGLGSLLGSATPLPKWMTVGLGVLSPLIVFVGLVVATALLHVSLFLVGGANEDFEATFRVICYCTSADLFAVFPLIGGLIGMIWRIYITVIGVREVHGISTGRSVLALSLPSLVCCGLALGGIVLVILIAGSSLTRT
jgi:hypothetical protein